MSAPELSAEERATVERFEAAPAAEESLRERVARELYRQWREEGGGDPADLPEWERLNEEGCDDDEPDPRGEYRRSAESLIAVLRGPSSDAEQAVERVLALAEQLDEPVYRAAIYRGEFDEGRKQGEDDERRHPAAAIRAAVAGDQ